MEFYDVINLFQKTANVLPNNNNSTNYNKKRLFILFIILFQNRSCFRRRELCHFVCFCSFFFSCSLSVSLSFTFYINLNKYNATIWDIHQNYVFLLLLVTIDNIPLVLEISFLKGMKNSIFLCIFCLDVTMKDRKLLFLNIILILL